MNIYGIEKMSLVDYDGYCACTLFTGACNFRCPFCQNAALVVGRLPEPIANAEIAEYLEKRKNVLDAVVISGGEPTLQKDLPEYVTDIKSKYGYKVKLDTNGSNFAMLKELVENGLIDYVAMDIKNSLDDYDITVGIEDFDFDEVRKSAEYLLQGKVDYEFRTTLVDELHSENNILKIADWLKGAKRYYLQKFDDKGGNIAEDLHAVSEDEAKKYLGILQNVIGCVELRGY